MFSANLAAALIAFLPAAAPPEPAQLVAGKWWLNGNGSYGNLELVVDADGKVSGTVYGELIIGQFDAAQQRLIFKRLHQEPKKQADGKGPEAVQEYTGTLTQISKLPPQFKLAGTFVSIAGDKWGAPGKSYSWSAQATRFRPPADDITDMQGNWTVAGITLCNNKEVKLPAELFMDEQGAAIVVRRNEIVANGKPIATLTNDLNSKTISEEVGFSGHRPLVITLPSGKGLLCSYGLREDGVEIAYPHTTSCHRGSGHIVLLKRPAK